MQLSDWVAPLCEDLDLIPSSVPPPLKKQPNKNNNETPYYIKHFISGNGNVIFTVPGYH